MHFNKEFILKTVEPMRYLSIKSASNKHIKEGLEVRNRRNKHGHEAFLLESPHLIEMALASGSRIQKVFFTEAFSAREDSQRLLTQLSNQNRDFFLVPENILEKLSSTEAPQGVVAIASYCLSTPDKIPLKSKPLIVVLDNIQDPGNLGTIIRVSDAAGADAVLILPDTCDPFMPKVIRATAGSIFNVPLVYIKANELLDWLRMKKIGLIATALDADKTIYDADLSKPLAFVFGNEARGASEGLKNEADMQVKIPIFGKAESLNVAVSAAICLYEAVRQRASQ